MAAGTEKPVYYRLEVVAESAATEIWLGDDAGHLVQRALGKLETSLLPGNYVVEFGLGTLLYPIRLDEGRRYSQRELAAGPTCARPTLRLHPE